MYMQTSPHHMQTSPQPEIYGGTPYKLLGPYPMKLLLLQYPAPPVPVLLKPWTLPPQLSRTNMFCFVPPPCAMVGKSTQAECQGEDEAHLMCLLPFSQGSCTAYCPMTENCCVCLFSFIVAFNRRENPVLVTPS